VYIIILMTPNPKERESKKRKESGEEKGNRWISGPGIQIRQEGIGSPGTMALDRRKGKTRGMSQRCSGTTEGVEGKTRIKGKRRKQGLEGTTEIPLGEDHQPARHTVG
jgi:hypothetical protein